MAAVPFVLGQGARTAPAPGPAGVGTAGTARHSAGRTPDAKSSSWNKPQPSLMSSCSRQLNSPAIVTLITSGNY